MYEELELLRNFTLRIAWQRVGNAKNPRAVVSCKGCGKRVGKSNNKQKTSLEDVYLEAIQHECRKNKA